MTSSRPRVTILGLNYPPELTGIAPYTAGIARGLSRDYEVEVITTHPHYPEWRVFDGYGGWRVQELDGEVMVRRLRHYVPSNPTGLSRIFSEATFALRAALTESRPDVVVAVTPALLPLISARLLRSRRAVPLGVVVQDLYSKAIVELGLLGGRMDKPVHALEARLLSSADGVVAIHTRMAETMSRDFGLSPERLRTIPNWTHVSEPSADRRQTRQRMGWGGEMVVVHAGNIGAKQGLEHVVRAARLADGRGARIRYVIVGGGGQRRDLQAAAQGVRSIEFLESLPQSDFTNVLAAADALLLHERPGLEEMCVPSKLTSYFAAARPVIAATSLTSAAAHEIRASEAGVTILPGSAEALTEAVESLAGRDDLDEMGHRGATYARTVLSEATALDSYRDWVGSLLASGPSGKR